MDLFRQFLEKNPEYENTVLDELRSAGFPGLKRGIVYADNNGAALPPKGLIKDHSNFLLSNLLGNPHSGHYPSVLATELATRARERILKFFNASPREYEVIFTKNASEAILSLRSYIFVGGELLLLADNHNADNGLSVPARQAGGIVRYAPINSSLQIDEVALKNLLLHPEVKGNKLFVYPLKSNYTGIEHSAKWITFAQKNGWDVLADCASYASNHSLDLSRIKPDFLPISFYKMFGYPTGLGCLIIKKKMYEKMHKGWFSGGTIKMVSISKDLYISETGYLGHEDGTINFAGIPAITMGLDLRSNMGDVFPRVKALTSWLYDQLGVIGLENKSIEFYSPKGVDTIAFNIKKKGKIIEPLLFERAASANGVYVRAGCFCNPGVNEKIFPYNPTAMYNEMLLHPNNEFNYVFNGEVVGAIRASFGYINNFSDVKRFADYVRRFLTAD
jgi:molybdenum cofactor sulfurtransferase